MSLGKLLQILVRSREYAALSTSPHARHISPVSGNETAADT